MCVQTSKIKLCTCGTLDETDLSIKYIWELKSIVNKGRNAIGKFAHPSFELDDKINEEKMAKALNEGNCFDFDYIPNENDQLQLRFNKNLNNDKFISFIFKEGKWKPGKWMHAVKRETKKIGGGYIETIN